MPWTAPPEREIFHWAEAAFYASLDLAEPLFAMALEPRALADLRSFSRSLVEYNRTIASATGRPAFMGAEYRRAAAEDRPHFAGFVALVEDDLISFAAPDRARHPVMAALLCDRRAAEIDALHPPDPQAGGFRRRVFLAMDAAFLNRLATVAFEIDSRVQREDLGRWDADILLRNRDIYGLTDPLRHLVATLRRMEQNRALARVRGTLAPEDWQAIVALVHDREAA